MVLVGRYLSPYEDSFGVSAEADGILLRSPATLDVEGSEKHPPLQPTVRIPALIGEDGKTLIDSRFIVDYLNVPHAELLDVDV